MNSFKLAIYFASYVFFPFVLCFVYYFRSGQTPHPIMSLVLMVALVLGYARFIEPKILLVKKHNIEIFRTQKNKSIRVALIADTHFGLFRNGISVKRLVKKLNQLNPDLVMFAGDVLYELDKKDIEKVLSPLKDLTPPTIVVTGNHDEGQPGPIYDDELDRVLIQNGLYLLNNKTMSYKEDVDLFGLSDLWARKYDLSVLTQIDHKKLNLLLLHNPDMAYKLPPDEKIDLILAGHTHGGQIRIPFVYKKIIPTTNDFDYGLYEKQNSYRVFVTSGIGMVGLPMRFLIPPRIDLLEINY